MSDSDFTPSALPDKPARPGKPYPDFPLFPHASGQWAKKIRGKMHYFGQWVDPDAALTRYLEQRDDLHAGRRPRLDPEAVTIKDIANSFLNAKKSLLDAGELSPHTFADYRQVCDLVVAHLGKARLAGDVGPDDFAALRDKVAKRWGPARLGTKLIQYTRSLFKHALEAGLIDRATRFGPGFKRPTKKVLRLARAEHGPQLFTADEIRRLLGAAAVQVRAMLLLGINCGLGNTDCAKLPLTAVDLDRGLIDYPRPKTGLPRRCPLWPETMTALREALARRPEPRDPAAVGLVFVTKYGLSWAKDESCGPLTQETRKLLNKLGINGRRNFYALRHTFRTIADEAKDQPAADLIMGHEVPHMSSVYRETISDARLRAVTEHVHSWLFGSPAGHAGAGPGE
jgi:integrase